MHDTLAAPSFGSVSWGRALFIAAALWGAALFWITEHPPMVDLPQHAAQVALLRDLVLGQSPWADIVRTNWLTPYLLGYGMALPLSLIMSAGTALKVLLTLAYLGFVALCVMLARHFNSDRRLDALFLVSFFGLAWSWGFVTFLITAPLVLAFVLMGSHYSRKPSAPAALLILGIGLLMLASHGLAFLFGWGVGASMLALEQCRRPRVLLPAFIPYAALGIACAGYFLFRRAFEAEFPAADLQVTPRAYWTRLVKVPLSTIGAFKEDVFLLPVALVLFAVPMLMGLRMRIKNWRAMVPLAVVSIFMLTIPGFAFNTSFLYERFAIFLLPAWAWAFPAEEDIRHAGWSFRRSAVASLLLLLCCAFVLLHDSTRILRFGRDTKAVDAALRQLQPGARILAMPFDAAALMQVHPDGPQVLRSTFNIASSEAANRYAHVHYAAWYQADSRGFADLNFAWFSPQIVRFRADRTPRIAPGFEWKPQSFDWYRHEGWRYRYFLVSGPAPAGIFQNAPCPPVTLFSDSTFTILENRSQSPDTAVGLTGTQCGTGIERPGARP